MCKENIAWKKNMCNRKIELKVIAVYQNLDEQFL